MISRTSELNPNKNLDTQDILYYNYYNTPIYPYYEKTPKNGGYIKLPCAYNLKSPNISCSLISSQYVCSAIYITKKLHEIANVSFDGELILEHTPITNGFKKVFVCIPLKSQVSIVNSENPIDIIIKNAKKEKSNFDKPVDYFALNQYLASGDRVIIYDSYGYLWNQTVILFSKPILVNSTFTDFVLDPELFHSYTNEYKVLACQQIDESSNHDELSLDQYEDSIIEGFDGITKTAYCQPIDVIDSAVADTANLEIPLTGKYSQNDATNNMVRMILNFTAFFTLLVMTFFGIPFVYDIFIIQLIFFNTGLATAQDKLNRLRSVDIFTTVVFVSFIFVLITGGVSTNNIPQVIVGFFIFIFFAVSFIRVQILKNDATSFLKDFGSNVYYSMIKDDIGNFLKDNVVYLLYSKKQGSTESVLSLASIAIVAGFFATFMFLSTLMGLIRLPKKEQKQVSSQAQVGISLYVFIFSVYIGILVKYWNEKSAGLSTTAVLTRALGNTGSN